MQLRASRHGRKQAGIYKAVADISCPAGKEILVTVKNPGNTKTQCLIHINLVARNFHFNFEEKNIYFSWSQDSMQKFGFDLGTVECPEVLLQEGGDFSGLYFATSMASGGTTEGFENCKFGMQPAEIALNACFYRLAAHGIEFGEFVGRTFIECLALQEIEVKVPECTIFIPEQLGTGGAGMRRVVFKDVGAGTNREITASISLKAIRYEEVGEGCKSGGPKVNGTFTGSWNLKTTIASGNQRGLSLAKTP